MVVFASATLVPMCLLRNLNSLRSAAILGLVSIVAMLIGIIANFFQVGLYSGLSVANTPSTATSFLRSIPLILYSWAAHLSM